MNITKDMTPVEAANFLAKLEEGHLAAWRSTREAPWHSAEYQARYQNAAEVHGGFRDGMRGAPHPDPFLAGRGWQVNEHGIYTRRAQPEPQAPPERELEAGS